MTTKEIRDKFITGTFAIGNDGCKEPPDWKDYAIKLEEHILSTRPVAKGVSDEEIEKEANKRFPIKHHIHYCDGSSTKRYYFIEGAKWLRNTRTDNALVEALKEIKDLTGELLKNPKSLARIIASIRGKALQALSTHKDK